MSAANSVTVDGESPVFNDLFQKQLIQAHVMAIAFMNAACLFRIPFFTATVDSATRRPPRERTVHWSDEWSIAGMNGQGVTRVNAVSSEFRYALHRQQQYA
jgi:hypothetical protein